VARLERNAVFGEMTLLTDEPRQATVRALEETVLLEVERCDLAPLLGTGVPASAGPGAAGRGSGPCAQPLATEHDASIVQPLHTTAMGLIRLRRQNRFTRESRSVRCRPRKMGVSCRRQFASAALA
jgi:hypothetical protein